MSTLAKLLAWLLGREADAAPEQPYRAYTTRFDMEVRGEHLPAMLRRELPENREAFNLALAEHARVADSWRAAADIAVAASAARLQASLANTVACLLIDHSGSLRGPPALLATVLAEVVADYWSRLGIAYELLGFTTATWHGGRSRDSWLDAGLPAGPGRLCDLLHIVYRAADETAPDAPAALRHLMHPGLLKENIDGEAVQWACARLRARPEARKLLIVLSDGAPVDDSTAHENGDDYLDRHLRQVVSDEVARGDVAIGAIAIGKNWANRYYENRIEIVSHDDLGDSLTPFLEDMLAGKPGRAGW